MNKETWVRQPDGTFLSEDDVVLTVEELKEYERNKKTLNENFVLVKVLYKIDPSTIRKHL
jgi:hypothetical protein